MNVSKLDRVLCALGLHGPVWLGPEPHVRSDRTRGFERTCHVCGTVWEGSQVYYPNVRALGDWRKVK